MEYRELMHRIMYLAKLHRATSGKRLAKMDAYAGQWMPVLRIRDGERRLQAGGSFKLFACNACQSVALSTKRMQKAGYLERKWTNIPPRCNKLHVTPQGRQLAADCKDAFDALDRESFKGFTEEELETFAGYLDRVAMNMAAGAVRVLRKYWICSGKRKMGKIGIEVKAFYDK